MKHKKIIAVFGGYRPKTGEPVYELSRDLGRQIAAEGWTLMNGGYGGTMEAAAQGASEAGGHVIGVTVSIFKKGPNAFNKEIIHTEDLWERIRKMIERSDAYIAVPGSTGTLAEVAMAWEFIYKGFIEPRPLILLGEFWRPLYSLFVTQPDPSAACSGLVRIEPTAQSAIDFLRTQWQR